MTCFIVKTLEHFFLNAGELKPTIFASVPRLFNRIYDKVLAGVKQKGAISQYLFKVNHCLGRRPCNHSNLLECLSVQVEGIEERIS
jgi:long-subunit acyl-CoA synthetase (AMP-forming)